MMEKLSSLQKADRGRGEKISVVYIEDTPNHIGGSKAIEKL